MLMITFFHVTPFLFLWILDCAPAKTQISLRNRLVRLVQVSYLYIKYILFFPPIFTVMLKIYKASFLLWSNSAAIREAYSL